MAVQRQSLLNINAKSAATPVERKVNDCKQGHATICFDRWAQHEAFGSGRGSGIVRL